MSGGMQQPPADVSNCFELPRVLVSSSTHENNSSSFTPNAPPKDGVPPPLGLSGLHSGSTSTQLQMVQVRSPLENTGGLLGTSNNRSSVVAPNQPNTPSLGPVGSLVASTVHVHPGEVKANPTPAETANDTSPLPRPESSQLPLALSETRSSSFGSAGPDSSTSHPEAVADLASWNHVLVVFDKLFCVCFVPPQLRGAMKVSELVLCEFAHGENIGTVVADVSPLVADIVQQCEASATGGASLPAAEVFAPSVERVPNVNIPASTSSSSAAFVSTTPLYREKAQCGLPVDHQLCRLPCVLRRGTNRDKKRVYFSRLRSNDALAAVQRLLLNEQLVAQGAEYQVNFSCATIYLAGDRHHCAWSAQQFQQLGNTLVDPLRCDAVEFRFLTERNHGELDLTRAIVGAQYTEALHDKVVEYVTRQGGRPLTSSQRSSPPGSGARQLHQQQQQQHMAPPLGGPQYAAAYAALPQHLSSNSSTSMAPSYTSSPMWSPPGAAPQIATFATMGGQPAMGYTLGPSIYFAQPSAPTDAGIPVTQPLSFAPSQYQTLQQYSSPTALYVTCPPGVSFGGPQPTDSNQQQQLQPTQPAMTLSKSSMPGSSVYYMMPSPPQQQQQQPPPTMQWHHAAASLQLESPSFLQTSSSPVSHVQAQPASMAPSFLHAASGPGVSQQQQQQQQPGTYVQLSAMNAPDGSPFVYSSSGVPLPPFQQ